MIVLKEESQRLQLSEEDRATDSGSRVLSAVRLIAVAISS